MVAEPWDFQSAYGRGRLRGHIRKIEDFGPQGGQALWLAVAGLTMGDQAVDTLRALALHPGDADLIAGLGDQRSVAVRLFGPPESSLRMAAAIRRL
ncbi:hypothetical protein [Phenylobacterium sp.]|uniref:hypothetical protein n=1 Tax=Phenylobacterium sp. TaxID=1871053 RepID=UPI00272F46EA|nr:hypothetical protein [Phenylobacterium sp.]MDP2212251.1 hypothetical protein [Phenylobacterium sp.]